MLGASCFVGVGSVGLYIPPSCHHLQRTCHRGVRLDGVGDLALGGLECREKLLSRAREDMAISAVGHGVMSKEATARAILVRERLLEP